MLDERLYRKQAFWVKNEQIGESVRDITGWGMCNKNLIRIIGKHGSLNDGIHYNPVSSRCLC
jgi:hypothetical protein